MHDASPSGIGCGVLFGKISSAHSILIQQSALLPSLATALQFCSAMQGRKQDGQLTDMECRFPQHASWLLTLPAVYCHATLQSSSQTGLHTYLCLLFKQMRPTWFHNAVQQHHSWAAVGPAVCSWLSSGCRMFRLLPSRWWGCIYQCGCAEVSCSM